MLVSNNLGGQGQSGALGQQGATQSLSFTLTDSDQTVVSNDALPTTALALSSFEAAQLKWELPTGTLFGTPTSLTPTAAVPEPGPGRPAVATSARFNN